MSDKADAKTEEAAPAKGGLGMVGLLVLGLACATTAFASVYFLAPAPAVASTVAASDGEYPVEEKKAEPPKALAYTPVPEILITVGSAPATRYLKMQLSVATEKAESKKIKSAEPQLIDAFLLYLRSVEVTDFEDPAFYKHMREQLGRRADLVLGDGIVEGVLITEFLLR